MQQVPSNPVATTTDVSIAPTPNVQYINIDYINAINGSAGPDGAQQDVLTTIQQTSTIIYIGPLTNSNTEQAFAVELNTIDVNVLQASIRALGTVDGVNLSGATVADKKLSIPV
jgi:hypothetical protein|tara:strand:+ start:272 stop:613 length:342 start_codon:yes stop_codon:yes gene_type:complete